MLQNLWIISGPNYIHSIKRFKSNEIQSGVMSKMLTNLFLCIKNYWGFATFCLSGLHIWWLYWVLKSFHILEDDRNKSWKMYLNDVCIRNPISSVNKEKGISECGNGKIQKFVYMSTSVYDCENETVKIEAINHTWDLSGGL